MIDQLELSSPAEVKEVSERNLVNPVAAASAENRLPSVTLGCLTDATPEHGPRVDFASNHSGATLPARSLVPLDESHAGCDVALVFEDGEVTRPIIVGVLQQWNTPRTQRLQTVETSAVVQVKHDEESLLLTASREITLQCGKASITLTSAGKLLLRGAYLLSRSSGVNRIKGGSVQIN